MSNSTIANAYLTFQGIGFQSHTRKQFSVMAGDTPPTITGGYAQYQNVPRPLSRGLTIFQGYDTVQMSLALRFGTWTTDLTWDTSDSAGYHLDGIGGDIWKLEWMAGGQFRNGPSPIVYVNSFGTDGGMSYLIPARYNGTGSSAIPWVINNIQWGDVDRNPSGYRVRQDATVTLMQYLNFTKVPGQTTQSSGGYFISKAGADTALKIVAAMVSSGNAVPAYQQTLASRIANEDRNNPVKGSRLKLHGSVKKFIKHGLAVWIPAHQI